MAIEDEKTILIDNIHSFDSALKDADDLLDTKIPAWVENGPATYRQRAKWWRGYRQLPKDIQEEVDTYHARNRFSQFFYWLFNVNDIAWKVQWQIHQDIVKQIEKDKKASKEGSIEISESFRPYIKFLNPSSIPSVWQRGWNNILSSVMTWWNGLFQPQQNKKKIVDQPQVQADPGDPMLLRAPYIKPRVLSEKKGRTLLTEIQQQDFYYLCGFFGLTPERVIESGLTEYCDALSSFGNQAVQNEMKVRLQRAAYLSKTLKKLNLSYSYSLFLDLKKDKKEDAIKQGNDDRLPATSIKMLPYENVEKKEEKEKIPEAPLMQLNESDSIQVAKILGLFFKTINEIEAEKKGGISPSTAEFKWNINDEIPSDVFKERRKALCLIVHPDKKREHIIPTLTLNTVDNAYKNFQKLCGGNKLIRLTQNEAVVSAYEEARKNNNPAYLGARMEELKKQAAEKDEKARQEIAGAKKRTAAAEKKIAEMEVKSRKIIENRIHQLKEKINSKKQGVQEQIINSMIEKISIIEQAIPTATQDELLDTFLSQLAEIDGQFQEEKQKITASQHMPSDTKSTATEAPTPTPSLAPVTIASPNSHIHGLFDAMASVPTTTTPPPVLKKEEKQNHHRESNETVTLVH